MRDVAALDLEIQGEEQPRARRLAELAARQHGAVARRQLRAIGFSPGAIDHRVATGVLHVVHRAVYAVGHPRLSGRGRWMAAVLACGDGALLSHRSAAAHRGLAPTAASRVEVTATRARHHRPGIIVHQARRLHAEDRDVVDGIPVTSVARTLLDLAEVVSSERLERAFEEAERLRVLDMEALRRLCERSRGRHALTPIQPLLAIRTERAAETRSELERSFLQVCRAHDLPRPLTNVTVAGLEVDALWPDRKLIVELDGFAFHHTRAAFERDRARDARLLLAGYRVLRVTARRLAGDPAAVAADVRSLRMAPA